MSDIRAGWARFVLKEQLKSSWRDLPELKGTKKPGIGLELPNIDKIELSEQVIGVAPDAPNRIKVGIVGAGAAGLFTGMIIDYLNKHVSDLNIDYEILEAAGEERLGGRLYTYKFPCTEKCTEEQTEKCTEEQTEKCTEEQTEKCHHQYYDVGAMRFPEIPIMKRFERPSVSMSLVAKFLPSRTFQLFDYIGLKDKLIPYYMTDKSTCNKNPTYYNDIHQVGSMKDKKDPYALNKFRKSEDQIPEEYAQY